MSSSQPLYLLSQKQLLQTSGSSGEGQCGGHIRRAPGHSCPSWQLQEEQLVLQLLSELMKPLNSLQIRARAVINVVINVNFVTHSFFLLPLALRPLLGWCWGGNHGISCLPLLLYPAAIPMICSHFPSLLVPLLQHNNTI